MPIGLIVSTLLPIILSMLGSGLATFRALPRANQVERLKAALSSNAFWAAGPMAVAAARTAARSDATLNALVAAIVMGGGTALTVGGAAVTAKYGVKTNGVHIVKKRKKNCGGDCGCAPCQSAARANPTAMAFRNRKPAARRNGIKLRAGETEFIHAAARVITDAHLTHNGLRVYAVADYGPGRAMLYTTHRTGRLYAPERGEAMIGSLTMNGPAMDLRVPSDTLHGSIVDALDAAGAFDPRRNPAGVGYGVAALLGAAGFVAGAYAESSLGLTQQFKGRKAAPAPAPRVLTTDAEWVSEEGKKPNQREYSRMIRGFMYYILTVKNLASRRDTTVYLDRGDGTRIKGPDGGDTFNTLAAAKKAAEADAAKRKNPTSMAFRNRAIHNHHIRVGGTFYTPSGRKGTVLAESPGYYRVRWSDGTLGSVQDSEMTAYPAEGSRANRRTNAGKGNFALITQSGMFNTRIVSRHATRDAAENAMKRWTGGYGSDSLMGQNYSIRDVSPGGNWEIIEIFGKQELRPRTRRNPGTRADADLLKGVLVDLARLARDEKEASKSRARRSYSPHTKEALARAAMLDMDAPRHRNPARSPKAGVTAPPDWNVRTSMGQGILVTRKTVTSATLHGSGGKAVRIVTNGEGDLCALLVQNANADGTGDVIKTAYPTSMKTALAWAQKQLVGSTPPRRNPAHAAYSARYK